MIPIVGYVHIARLVRSCQGLLFRVQLNLTDTAPVYFVSFCYLVVFDNARLIMLGDVLPGFALGI